MVGGIPDVLGRFSALGFESFEPLVNELQSGSEAVATLLTQLHASRRVSAFEVGWSDFPTTRFACAFDHGEKSLFMSLEQVHGDSSPAREVFSPIGALTKASSLANTDSDSENDTVSISDLGEEESDLSAEVARSIAIALVDIAESLEAQRMSCLLDIGHPLFNTLMRTLLSAGFVVRSKSSKVTLKRRQQLLTFSIEQERACVFSPPVSVVEPSDYLEGVPLEDLE